MGEAQANAGTCGPESLIGETVVSVGLGNDPFTVTGGRVYLTEKYQGAPFGLSIVNPAKAGPFDLQEGRPVIVTRAKIEIDPRTAGLTVTTGEIPFYQIRRVPVLAESSASTCSSNRPGFTFNPTNCSKMEVTGTVNAWEGASAPVSIPFQAGECRSLTFAPDFKVATSGKPTKANGTSLTARIVYPVTPESSGKATNEANIGYVKVELPEQLPSRLTTLQKACLAKVFDEDPAKCDPESIVGHAVVHTPLLPVPLEGPAYFVSHGNEEFPNLTMILQGYGVTVEVVGTTFISKAGVTSTTFKTPPDVPFNTFELNLPAGKYSALAAPSGTCQYALKMPTTFRGQNGVEFHQETPIEVAGCPLAIVSHKLKGHTLTVTVTVPSAGKLKLSGNGLSGASKTAKAHENLTFTLHVKKHGKFKTKVKMMFTPSHGKRQAKAVSLHV